MKAKANNINNCTIKFKDMKISIKLNGKAVNTSQHTLKSFCILRIS